MKGLGAWVDGRLERAIHKVPTVLLYVPEGEELGGDGKGPSRVVIS